MGQNTSLYLNPLIKSLEDPNKRNYLKNILNYILRKKLDKGIWQNPITRIKTKSTSMSSIKIRKLQSLYIVAPKYWKGESIEENKIFKFCISSHRLVVLREWIFFLFGGLYVQIWS